MMHRLSRGPEEQDLSCGLQRMNGLLQLRYKQLPLAADQEWILEQGKMQTELNWQQLCENAEHNRYQKSEDPTQSLSSSREEYDDKTSLCKDIPTLEIKKLQKQNASLRAAIAQMRKEMESLDEQMLSSLPLTENRQLVEQGSASTNKISTATTLSNIKVSPTKLDCIVNPDTEKGPEPTVLEEEIVDLGQELPDVGPGVELQYGVRHTLQGMQNKLKEAARKISVLNQERRQLIEMGNRLRAELGMMLKEVELEVIHSTKQSEESQQNVKAKDKLEVPAGDLTVRGTRLEVQQKVKSRNLSCAHPLKPKISSNMAKIRNYNIKD
ncbi:coiled-coil domain containing 57 [Pitangus sulphuratus]|nr:coiled-coil domain containing 57 [Pitangus sulphuratus]